MPAQFRVRRDPPKEEACVGTQRQARSLQEEPTTQFECDLVAHLCLWSVLQSARPFSMWIFVLERQEHEALYHSRWPPCAVSLKQGT